MSNIEAAGWRRGRPDYVGIGAGAFKEFDLTRTLQGRPAVAGRP